MNDRSAAGANHGATPSSPAGTDASALPGLAPVQHPLRGALLIMAAVLTFSVMDTFAKYLGRIYPIPGLLWARYLAHLAIMFMLLAPRMQPELFRTDHLLLQVVRGLLLVLSTFCFFHALRYLPLAEAASIGFLHPLLVVALSGPLLGEKVSMGRWVAVLTGFFGVLVIIRPGGGLLTPAAVLPIVMALCYTLYQIITRKLSGREHALTTLFYTALVGSVASTLAILVPGGWLTPTPLHGLMILGMGALGGLGHFLLIKAFECAPASTLAPFSFTQIVWMTLLGYLVYGDFPNGGSLLGMLIILGSGLYVALAERGRPR